MTPRTCEKCGRNMEKEDEVLKTTWTCICGHKVVFEKWGGASWG
jgi:hypothetical protein